MSQSSTSIRLAKNASQGADRNLAPFGYDGGIHDAARMSQKLNVATFLTRFDEPGRFQQALDLTEGWGLSRPNLNLDGANPGGTRGLRRLEVELKRFFQVGQRLFFTFTLAGNITLEALGNIPVAFAPYSSGERSLHDHILSLIPHRLSALV